MTKLLNSCISLIIVIMLISCSENVKDKIETNTFSNYYKNQIELKYSKSFSVDYQDSSKILKVFAPDDSNKVIYQYYLTPNTYKHKEKVGKYQVIQIPIKSVVTLSSIYIGFLDKLNLQKSIKGVDDTRYIGSPIVRKLIDEGNITKVGSTVNLNLEKVLEINPDVLFTYGNGNPTVDGHQKLMRAGINVASSTSHLENNPLARAEWIKFVAVFFNKEKDANIIFNDIEKNYYKTKEIVKNAKTKPTVFTQAIYGGVWYTPAGNSYIAKLLNDAGADYLWKENTSTGSLRLTYEQVFVRAEQADMWLNVHNWFNLKEALENDSRNAEFNAYKKGELYNNNKFQNGFGGNRYWESGIIEPDIILKDLVKIFHSELLPDYKTVYYQKLKNEK